jgi:hypothetical protein
MKYIYKVTNKLNNKIYIGQTAKNDSNYLGSGTIILKAVLKYGFEVLKGRSLKTKGYSFEYF